MQSPQLRESCGLLFFKSLPEPVQLAPNSNLPARPPPLKLQRGPLHPAIGYATQEGSEFQRKRSDRSELRYKGLLTRGQAIPPVRFRSGWPRTRFA